MNIQYSEQEKQDLVTSSVQCEVSTSIKKRIALIVVVLGSCVVVTNAQQANQEQRMNFVNCPVVQDTKTVPCWVSEYRGEARVQILIGTVSRN